MFLKFKAPDRHNDIIVAREDISVISSEFLYTRSGQRFRIYPIDKQELKRFGLVSVPPLCEESNAMGNVTKSGRK